MAAVKSPANGFFFNDRIQAFRSLPATLLIPFVGAPGPARWLPMQGQRADADRGGDDGLRPSFPPRRSGTSGGPAARRPRSRRPNRDAFSHPSANMPFKRRLDFEVGDGIFSKIWVSSPSSTRSSDGLGPLFNARSCQSCHVKDGRGRPPAPGDPASSMVFRLSAGPDGKEPDPVYGGQFQNRSVQGVPAEGRMVTNWEEFPARLAGDGSVWLRRPRYALADLRYGPPAPDLRISPRIAPPMIGVGLLEAVSEDDILARADPDDRDGDGISGRPNWVWSDEHGRVMPGRFGWKAGQPTLAQQTAAAFRGDIGISTPLYPAPYGDCTAFQKACRNAPHGGNGTMDAEAEKTLFDALMFYVRNLAVPARRDIDHPEVLRGKRLFYEAGVRHLPYAQVRDTPRHDRAGAIVPADLALYRPAPA